MEFVILIVAVIAVLAWFIWKDRRFDDSGSHPLDGATKNAVVETLDVNKDGKVDIKDAVAAADIVVEKTKKVAKTTKAKAQKVVGVAKKAVKKTKTKKSS
jgi:hypothetical protein